MDQLPRDRQIVAYCRGPYCALAPEAVAVLRGHGFDARRLEDGLPEWAAAGRPYGPERKHLGSAREADTSYEQAVVRAIDGFASRRPGP